MAATSDEGMESLLSCFDQIYEDVRSGIAQVQSLQSSCNAELKKREALQCTVEGLKSDNERLTKLYMEAVNKLADQFAWRTNCHSLKEELERVRNELRRIENEYRTDTGSLKQDHASKIEDLETQITGFLIQKAEDEATIKQLHQDLSVHKTHIGSLTSKLDQVYFDVESRYRHEIQDLKDCLLVEQEEKKELNRTIQNLEKELLISRTKLADQQRDLTSTRYNETLKQKIMKLRKENEVLRRQLSGLKEG